MPTMTLDTTGRLRLNSTARHLTNVVRHPGPGAEVSLTEANLADLIDQLAEGSTVTADADTLAYCLTDALISMADEIDPGAQPLEAVEADARLMATLAQWSTALVPDASSRYLCDLTW